MAKNNHSDINSQTKIDGLLRHAPTQGEAAACARAVAFAESVVAFENCIAVVSCLASNTSRIIAGKFASAFALDGYCGENSIWEKRILALMTPDDCQAKFITELRFYNFLKKVAPSRRADFCLVSKLTFSTPAGERVDVRHRMFYIYADVAGRTIAAAVCLYSPMLAGDNSKSYALDTATGLSEELTAAADDSVLSRRERQVLALINAGKTSREIASLLNISVHTVSRHRQSILSALNVGNSHQACLIARSMGLI